MLLDDPIAQEPPHELIVNAFESCVPYLVIDNFYNEKELSLIWNELNFLLDGDKFNPSFLPPRDYDTQRRQPSITKIKRLFPNYKFITIEDGLRMMK